MTYKVFQIDIYNTLVGIVYFKNEKKDIDDIINTFGLSQDEILNIYKVIDSSKAFMYPIEIKTTKYYVCEIEKSYYKYVNLIFLINNESIYLTHGVIAHEINHIADHICDNTGMTDTEAKSYLITYITNCMYTFIRDNHIILHYIDDLKIDFGINIEKPFLHI